MPEHLALFYTMLETTTLRHDLKSRRVSSGYFAARHHRAAMAQWLVASTATACTESSHRSSCASIFALVASMYLALLA